MNAPDGDVLVLVLYHGAAIVVHIQVVGRAEDRNHRREFLRRSLAMHRISRVLRLVATEYAQQLIAFQEFTRRFVSAYPETCQQVGAKCRERLLIGLT